VNHICGHFSPLKEESYTLKEGDVVKIDLGTHIDGYISQGAYTIVSRKNREEKVTGRKADVITAAHTALQAAIRTFKAENKNHQVTAMIKKSAEAFETQPLESVFSSKQKKHLIDTVDSIANRHQPEQRVDEYTFQPGDVFYLDILVSTGEGKARESEYRTTVYKRQVENTYLLKIQSSRVFFSEVNQKYPTLPFSIRALEHQTAAKVGIKECQSHELIQPFPVVVEKEGEFVA
jgi:curved DNA binding protein